MNSQRLALSFELGLPDWAIVALDDIPEIFPALEDRMRLVIAWARQNFERDTGGPFAAAVFEEGSGRLVSVGVNRVVPERCSSAHAEVVALTLAQRALKSFDLGGAGLPNHQLVVNWRPCAMCFGAIPWSGVRSLVIAGSGGELEAITGFDEGPVPADWKDQLENRGIAVIDGLFRTEAREVFEAFAESGRLVYNGRRA